MNNILTYLYVFFFVINSIVLVVDTFEINELIKKEFQHDLDIKRLKAMMELPE